VSAQEKRVKWEYAELMVRSTPARPAGKDKDGNEVPGGEPKTTIRWTTGAGEINLKGWDELAEKLKATVKKEDSMSLQKIQVLNALGADGAVVPGPYPVVQAAEKEHSYQSELLPARQLAPAFRGRMGWVCPFVAFRRRRHRCLSK
jgi:hypothetical protein